MAYKSFSQKCQDLLAQDQIEDLRDLIKGEITSLRNDFEDLRDTYPSYHRSWIRRRIYRFQAYWHIICTQQMPEYYKQEARLNYLKRRADRIEDVIASLPPDVKAQIWPKRYAQQA